MPFLGWSDATNAFFTIGHSNRRIVDFADLLRESGVNLVVDRGRALTRNSISRASLNCYHLGKSTMSILPNSGVSGEKRTEGCLRPMAISECAAFGIMLIMP